MTHSIDPHELSRWLAAGEATLLDVRRRADAEADPRTLQGASWRDPERIDAWVAGVPENRKAVVYCVKGGSVSRSVTDRLRREGRNAVFLDGGLKRWTEEGRPVAVRQKTYAIAEADVERLRQAGVSEADIAHSVRVARKALEIAGRIRVPLDLELVGRGALFHDLGKARTHEIEHGKLGAEMGRAMGLSPAITALMEKHIRGGLTPEEAVELGLPVKDYRLHRLEERIVIYADRLVDIITDGIVAIGDEKDAEARFREILSTVPKYGKNERTLERYLGYHREIQGLAAS